MARDSENQFAQPWICPKLSQRNPDKSPHVHRGFPISRDLRSLYEGASVWDQHPTVDAVHPEPLFRDEGLFHPPLSPLYGLDVP